MNDFLLAVASFALLLVPMIFIHELGHFIAAKLVKITVLEFGLGFPPRLAKLFERGGTEYTLNWLPLGGFVRPLGEDFVRPVGDEASSSDRDEAIRRGVKNPKSVNQATPWERLFFMASGAGANVVAAVILFIVMALVGLPVVRGATVAVREITPNSPAAAAGLQPDDVITRVDGNYIDSSTALAEYFNFNQGEQVTLTVERNGESFEVPIWLDETSGTGVAENVIILGVVVDSPADRAGLQPGDLILAANGETIRTTDELVNFTEAHRGETVSLLIERNGEQMTLELIPRVEPPQGEGPMGVSIGTAQSSTAFGATLTERDAIIDYEPSTLGDAIEYGFKRTVETVSLIVEAPVRIIRGELSAEAARPVSIIGISQIGGMRLEQSVQLQSVLPLLDFAAVIGLALGLTNLLPIPGLDGGRILFVIIELLRGKPLEPEREGMIHLIGLFLLLGVMGIFILNDLVNPIVTNFR